MRRRCVRRGHDWRSYIPVPMPFQFCRRWHCDAERVNPAYPMDDSLRRVFEQLLLDREKERLGGGQ